MNLFFLLPATVVSYQTCNPSINHAAGGSAAKKKDTVSLSPADWPDGEFERLERLSLSPAAPKPLAFSAGRGMVSGTSSAFAVHSGVVALRKGGNAMDACLATALTRKELVGLV